MAKAVKLANGKSWRTRTAAIEHFREMLKKYRPGQTIDDAADHDDLAALLHRYDGALPPGSPTKRGSGISHFSKQLNMGEGWTSLGFHVHRVDGTSDDFSIRHAVNDGKDEQ